MSSTMAGGLRTVASVPLILCAVLGANGSMAQSKKGPGPAANKPFEGTYWRASELAGTPTPAHVSSREAHLVFFSAGRLSGSDGCNRITGTYQLQGNAITFGQIASTQMVCIDAVDRQFREALRRGTRMRLAGDRLELFDSAGVRVAAFAAVSQSPPVSGLQGSSWQLVQFQGGDGTTLTPDDGAKYTIEFGAGGRMTARIDCNRGRGAWMSNGPPQLQLGPLALTRAKCPPGSLHDQIVKQWPNIRSYQIRDGHLFLSLMADGGIYEFEPIKSREP